MALNITFHRKNEEDMQGGACGAGVDAMSRVARCTSSAVSVTEPASWMRSVCMFTGASVPSGSVSVSPDM
jgi:hypothetical protein